MAIIDSYSEANRDANFNIYITGQPNYGQSFTGDGKLLTSCEFYLRKNGSPTGNLQVHVYAHSGVYGTSSLPAAEIAISSEYNVSGLTDSHQLIEFTFSGGSRIILENGTKYCIVIYFAEGDGANSVLVGYDDSSPNHSGNAFAPPSTSYPNKDICFYVYGITEYTLTADVGAFILTGISVLFTKTLNLICAVGNFTLTGIASILSKGYILVATVGTFILTGIAAIFTIISKWTRETKHTTNFTEQSKNTTTFSEQSKNTTDWTEQDKS